jgi:hypothetical protein
MNLGRPLHSPQHHSLPQHSFTTLARPKEDSKDGAKRWTNVGSHVKAVPLPPHLRCSGVLSEQLAPMLATSRVKEEVLQPLTAAIDAAVTAADSEELMHSAAALADCAPMQPPFANGPLQPNGPPQSNDGQPLPSPDGQQGLQHLLALI